MPKPGDALPNRPVFAVILAGGSGSRLWPLSRQQLPKQYLALNGAVSLLQETIERLQPLIAASRVLVVTSETHARGEAYHTLLPYRTLLEPVARNTAPAIGLAAMMLREEQDDPLMVVLPADHIIRDVGQFHAHLEEALEVAARGSLVTFGIRPTRPDTGFGYLRAAGASPAARPVERFVEKPPLADAERFLREGGYYWNSGMFVWRASVILEEIARHLPELQRVLEEMQALRRQGAAWPEVIKLHFARAPSISIDHGVLERSDRVMLIPADIGWSDVGSWQAVHEIAPKDGQGNSIGGNVIALDCRDSLVRSEKRLVAAIGVENLCVVETADAVLVARRDQSQRVKEVVDALQCKGSPEYLSHLTVRRPWGYYTVLEDSAAGFKIKRIEVDPGASLSLQRHRHRSEHWVVVSGTATVTRDRETYTVAKNESTYIPIGVKHRLENRGQIPLQIIEVQVGDYVGEDDIERFDDRYGRTDEPKKG
ncbi:MAG: mannose-1-phosphate guanylyltransferase/mannose-6-phosphate isomerase [Betaproteobacteria bacterium]|nr:mannose-1-phosphate guanylyltransferase/mannose-6-phosphate isomerase [Betaproteobacteria bacterium]